ncbi:MAG: deoxyribodipyrimidine photo-lyase [Bacteriovoracia bacterium]
MSSPSSNSSLVWLRRDLRLYDQAALSEATKNSDKIALVFVFDEKILKDLPKNDRRITFIFESLQEISSVLRKKNSELIVRYGDPTKEIPELALKLGVGCVYTNHDYESYAKKRDDKIKRELLKSRINFKTFKDQVIFEKDEILTATNTPFKVFTPYSRAWLKKLEPKYFKEKTIDFSKLISSKEISKHSQTLDLDKIGFKKSALWLTPGETAARKRLGLFCKIIGEYKDKRDFPAANATSGLSVHLRFGTISIRDCVRVALEQIKSASKKTGAETWLKELIWREFYQMILDQFPYVAVSAFKKEYDSIKWPGKEEHFQAWCEGNTGFPIVDAAMRHFNETGWMHNRLRMIVASFLVKDLLVDWKKGEKYFAQNLLDFDLASNNGGWQWCASTGCDAQPYFRIFNPDSQTKKFDPKKEFINQYVKKPTTPIIDHSVQRLKAIRLYKQLTF